MTSEDHCARVNSRFTKQCRLQARNVTLRIELPAMDGAGGPWSLVVLRLDTLSYAGVTVQDTAVVQLFPGHWLAHREPSQVPINLGYNAVVKLLVHERAVWGASCRRWPCLLAPQNLRGDVACET